MSEDWKETEKHHQQCEWLGCPPNSISPVSSDPQRQTHPGESTGYRTNHWRQETRNVRNSTFISFFYLHDKFRAFNKFVIKREVRFYYWPWDDLLEPASASEPPLSRHLTLTVQTAVGRTPMHRGWSFPQRSGSRRAAVTFAGHTTTPCSPL